MKTMEQFEKDIRKDFENADGFDALVVDIIQTSESVDPELHSEIGGGEASIDCRLRYHNGSFYWLVGLSDYDQDHRGHWGCCSVLGNLTKEHAKSLAEHLLEQVIDSANDEFACNNHNRAS